MRVSLLALTLCLGGGVAVGSLARSTDLWKSESLRKRVETRREAAGVRSAARLADLWEGGPVPKHVETTGGDLGIDAPTLQMDEALESRLAVSVNRIVGSGGAGTLTLRVEVAQSGDGAPWPEASLALTQPEGYWIELGPDGGRIVGSDTMGVARAMATLERLVINGQGGIPTLRVADWPDHRVRALHFVLRGVTPDKARRLIDQARLAQFNTLILHLADAVRLESLPRIARADAWAPSDLAGVANYARASGFDLVPELKLLTHQEKLLKKTRPELLYNAVTLDPRKSATYDLLLPAMDEVIQLMKPRAFHIGHDEARGIAGRRKGLKRRDRGLPAGLFLRSVERLHRHLASRGVETWMWGDMLLDPERFPAMPQRQLHGNPEYAALLDRIPHDIIICDWHYKGEQPDFPTALAFARAGHPVLGATWKRFTTTRNFSRYVAELPFGGLGMIATTWSEVQKGNRDTVERIIETSGAAFWNAL